jgi:hypothetical protein
MYYLEGIEKLSPTQAKKLMSGSPVRVKKGPHHKIHMRADQIKKLNSSHMKGKGTTLMMDPYQIDMNRETLGGALSMKKVGRVLKKGFDKYVKPQIRPLLHQALNKGVEALTAYAPETMPIASSLHNIGSHAIDTAGTHYGFGLKKSVGRPKKAPRKKLSMVNPLMSGVGKRGPGRPRKVGRPRKTGGALYPPM